MGDDIQKALLANDKQYIYIFEKDRLDSFEGKWKTLKGYKYCTPAKFAAAGFFYMGSKEMPDNVKCFACRKELNEWEKNDDPWEEHKKRGEKCIFVRLKSKPVITFKDFMQLYYEVRKNIFIESVDEMKKILEENHDTIIEMLTSIKKKK